MTPEVISIDYNVRPLIEPFISKIDNMPYCVPAIDQICDLAHQARKSGLLSLESVMKDEPDHCWIKQGIEMLCNGLDREYIAEYYNIKLVMSNKVGYDLIIHYIIARGILGILEGLHPRYLRALLEAYVP